jgi:hypothetical protein
MSPQSMELWRNTQYSGFREERPRLQFLANPQQTRSGWTFSPVGYAQS